MDFFNIHTHSLRHPETEILSLSPDRLSHHEDGIHVSIGIHPWHTTEENADSLWNSLSDYIAHHRVMALGECGLDRLKGPSMDLQKSIFRKEIALSEAHSLPMIIHCVKAYNDLIRLKKEYKPRQPWIIHGFRGKASVAQDLLRHGFRLSFGSRFQEESVRLTPLDRLFIETDESEESIGSIYRRIADVRGISTEELAEAVKKNVQEVFFKP